MLGGGAQPACCKRENGKPVDEERGRRTQDPRSKTGEPASRGFPVLSPELELGH